MADYTINRNAAATVAALDAKLAQYGIVPGPDLFEPGAYAGSRTEEGYQRVRSKHAELPLAVDACDGLSGRVRAEDREDFILGPRETRMIGGRLMTEAGSFVVEEAAIGSVFGVRTIGVSAGQTAAGLIRDGRFADRDALYNTLIGNGQTKPQRFRTRKAGDAGDDRAIYGIVSSRYTVSDVDALADALRATVDKVGGDARGDISYDGERMVARVTWFREHREPCTGDTFKVGIALRGGDTGRHGIRGDLVAFRNHCLNYVVIGESSARVVNRIHVGDKKTLQADILAGLAKAEAFAADFVDTWGRAARDVILGEVGPADPADVFARLVASNAVRVPGIKPDALKDRLLTAWNLEPGYTRSAYVNAITRAAHNATWASKWTTHDLEAQAGKLLYQRVFVRL